MLVAAASCLVTSTPDLKDAPQQPPYLIAAGASPDQRFPKVIKDLTQPVPFTASVYSSNPTEVLKVELLIDYGTDRVDGFKALDRVGPKDIPVTGSNIRSINKPFWFPSTTNATAGCHTVTMIVTHEFDSETACPMRLCDSSQLTWFVNLQPPPTPTTPDCAPDPNKPLPPECACPTPKDTCPADALPAGASDQDRQALRQKFPCPGDDADAGAVP